VEKAYKVEQSYVAAYTDASANQNSDAPTNQLPPNSDKSSAWDQIAHTPSHKPRPIKGNIESYFNEAENIWTEMSLKRKYGDALLENPALELNQLKQINKWADLNIEITMQTGEKFMRAELTLDGEKVVGLASSKKSAKAAACQVICMLIGFYKPGCSKVLPAPLASKLLVNKKAGQKRAVEEESREQDLVTGGFQELADESDDHDEPAEKVAKVSE
jgi:hypothetical protein